MKNYNNILLLFALAAVLLLGSCSKNNLNPDSKASIEFSANSASVSSNGVKADNGEITNMPAGSKFPIRMYYITGNTEQFNANESTFIKIDDALACKYTNADFTADESDAATTKFYWNNRKNHGFLAYYLNSTTQTASFTGADANGWIKFTMADQKDPMVACKVMQPSSGGTGSNIVPLLFTHQFSKIQVNVNPDKISVGANGEKIKVGKVYLLGISKTASICTKLSNTGVYTEPTASTEAYEVDAPYLMTDEATAAIGYMKTTSSIAFGKLTGFVVYWYEVLDETDSSKDVEHKVIYMIPETDIVTLKSGKKYIFSISLRRGTVVTMDWEIVDWEIDTGAYESDGIIDRG